MFEDLSLSVVKALCSPRVASWLQSIQYLESCSSTNTYIMDKLRMTHEGGHLAIAGEQSAGRGQFNRRWIAAKDHHLLMSFSLDLKACRLTGLSLVIGLAVIEALASQGVSGLKFKWPNDIMYGDAKLAGILIETLVRDESNLAVVGLGLNIQLNDQEKSILGREAISLSEMGHLSEPAELVVSLLEKIIQRNDEFYQHAGSLETMLPDFQALDYLLGQNIIIEQNAQAILGQAMGIDKDGALKFQNERGEIHTVVCGQIKVKK